MRMPRPVSEIFPVWDTLAPDERAYLAQSAVYRTVPKGKILQQGKECVGLFLIESGQLRSFLLSDEGKEVTLFRLLDGDICLFSSSCVVREIQFDVTIESEKETNLWMIPFSAYDRLMKSSLAVSNYTTKLMATRFSEVMWVMEQIVFKSIDARLAQFLLEESALEESDRLSITHEKIARHMGTAREVVTRMLKYFSSEELVQLSRGGISIVGRKGLENLAKQ
ncbi:MAG: Crp/Fnr family transcriptional regulator [Clostridiales bacterium]|nr:Crp/Fnr family transcriptional regulator [Clostridiales bacterium]